MRKIPRSPTKDQCQCRCKNFSDNDLELRVPSCQDVPTWTSLAYSLACDSYRAGDEPQALSSKTANDPLLFVVPPIDAELSRDDLKMIVLRFFFSVPFPFFVSFSMSFFFLSRDVLAIDRVLTRLVAVCRRRGKVYLSGTSAYLFPSFLCS